MMLFYRPAGLLGLSIDSKYLYLARLARVKKSWRVSHISRHVMPWPQTTHVSDSLCNWLIDVLRELGFANSPLAICLPNGETRYARLSLPDCLSDDDIKTEIHQYVRTQTVDVGAICIDYQVEYVAARKQIDVQIAYANQNAVDLVVRSFAAATLNLVVLSDEKSVLAAAQQTLFKSDTAEPARDLTALRTVLLCDEAYLADAAVAIALALQDVPPC